MVRAQIEHAGGSGAHDLLVQARDGDLVAGTYGRGIWQTHIAPLREMGGDFLKQDAALFATVQPFATRRGRAWGNFRLYGDRYPLTPNEPNSMTIAYYLSKEMPVSITVADASGKAVRKLAGPAKAGINRALWDLNDDSRNPLPAGDYVVTLNAGGREYKAKPLTSCLVRRRTCREPDEGGNLGTQPPE